MQRRRGSVVGLPSSSAGTFEGGGRKTNAKERMKARGDTGNIKRAEQTIDLVQDVKAEVASLTAKVDAILKHLNIPEPNAMQR